MKELGNEEKERPVYWALWLIARGEREKALLPLRQIEWAMGNGQCPFCYGTQPAGGWWTKLVGHKRRCFLAETIGLLNAEQSPEKQAPVKYERENRSVERSAFKEIAEQIYPQAEFEKGILDALYDVPENIKSKYSTKYPHRKFSRIECEQQDIPHNNRSRREHGFFCEDCGWFVENDNPVESTSRK